MIQTRPQVKVSGVQSPEVDGSRKEVDPHKILEKQPQPIVSSNIERKPRLGQGRAGVRRKIKAPPSQYTGPGSSEIKQKTVPKVMRIKPKTGCCSMKQ